MSAPPVSFAVDDCVATITLNRPEAGNAIDMALAAALLARARECHDDRAIRCVVLTGAGKLFCAGGDVREMARVQDRSAFLADLAGTLHEALKLLAQMGKPLVVLVNGPAAGAGLSLAIGGDAVLASDNASFTSAYSSVGLTPDGGMSWLLPRLVGLRAAQRMLILGETITAAEARMLGMVTRIVPIGDLAAEGRALARRLADGPVIALGGARALLREGASNAYQDHLDREAESIECVGASAEAAEGIAAFVGRRTPVFPRFD